MKIIRAIFFIINLVAALGLVATTLAGVASPSKTALPSLLAYGYLPMLALNVVFALLWLLFGRWEMLLSVAAIAARWAMLPLFIQAGGTSKVPPADEHPYMVTMMTYNVHQFQGNGHEEAKRDSIARLFVRLVRNEDPDVLCLQEYAAVKGVNITDSLAMMGYNHYAGSHRTGNGAPYGTVVFSRLPITYVKVVDGQKVLVELMRDGQRMRVLNVHMDSYGMDRTDFEAVERMRRGDMQREDRRTLAKVKETVLNHEKEWHECVAPMVEGCTVPMVVAGDMNDIPSSWLYHKMTRSLKDTYVEKGVGFGTTYSGGFPAFRIDMIMHNDGLKTLSYKRIKSPLSDHYPVKVAMEFEI
ncbi:MAG: endonuclease/exonuclease/phosphatase family protein [Bacteroidales bacterium]|nr:endonuclease/exonuclease/phosphatase family protein [Bacteroidales bacterium]